MSHVPCDQGVVPPTEASDITTDIHFANGGVGSDPATHAPTGITVTMGATVHDSAVVTTTAVGGIPAGSTVTFNRFSTNNCTGAAVACTVGPTSAALPSGSIFDEESDPSSCSPTNVGPLGVGVLSYNASFTSGDTTTVSNSGPSNCEPLEVKSSISGFSYSVVSGSTVLQAGPFDCTLETSTDTTLPDGVNDLCAATKSAAVVTVSKKGSVTSDYLVTVTVTNDTGGTITEKVQGGLAAKAVYATSTGVPYSPNNSNVITIVSTDIDCIGNGANADGVATINLSSATTGSGNTGNVVVWNSTGVLGSSTNPVAGFTMDQGAVCTLQVIVRKGYSSNQLQAVTSSWSEFQEGPGSFSGKSPYTDSLATCVLGNGFTGDGDGNCNP